MASYKNANNSSNNIQIMVNHHGLAPEMKLETEFYKSALIEQKFEEISRILTNRKTYSSFTHLAPIVPKNVPIYVDNAI
jgi:hypothetical protein